MKLALFIATCLTLSACSSIISGTSQTLTINTTPEGADCKLTRNNLVIGHISPTPSSIVVQKTKYDIFVECTKKGYQKATFINKSGTEGATFGNIVLGGGIGWAVDSAAGADNHYQDIMNITLTR